MREKHKPSCCCLTDAAKGYKRRRRHQCPCTSICCNAARMRLTGSEPACCDGWRSALPCRTASMHVPGVASHRSARAVPLSVRLSERQRLKPCIRRPAQATDDSYTVDRSSAGTADDDACEADADGSVASNAMLIAGTVIGAGFLALPQDTQDAGWLPASIALTSCAVYAVASGLLIAEAHINAERRGTTVSSSPGALVDLAGATLGPAGGLAAHAAFLFLHFVLLTACERPQSFIKTLFLTMAALLLAAC